MAGSKQPPKKKPPKLTWFLDVWPTNGSDSGLGRSLFEFPATTQIAALRKARKAIADIQIEPNETGRRTQSYQGPIAGELCVAVEGSDEDPQTVFLVHRAYYYDKPNFTLV